MPHRSRSDRPQVEPGRRIGPYRVDALIGSGGMGQVYRATREPDGQAVALKVIKREIASDERAARRFIHEARAAAQVQDKHLVGVLDAGESEGLAYMVMPLVSGQTLEQRIEDEGPLSIEDINRMAAQVGAGLDALHGHELVHRDVKASNIIFGPDGDAALMDFGLAKGTGYSTLTSPGRLVGTLDYLAPELIRGDAAGPGSDLYALGCVVFEGLAGHPPFQGNGVLQVGMAHLNAEPANPCAQRDDAPQAYGQAVLAALAKDPAERPPTATAYANMLGVAARAPGR